MASIPKISMEDRLFLVQRNFDKKSHIAIDQESFKKDPIKPILFLCPAKVFILHDTSGECIINHENCLECGTCQVASRYVKWTNPSSGFGVTYKYS
ncbi:MAG: 4Fe-4S dicluster domain-containing protein [Chlamydiae bacterium]|nr:4Fe-4S dicluster domain-containing protein [Chlamydiota bacterium]MBI3277054.1 4Fe-4S dicluster domain-containing protein [Chlamydiota bacterium]